MSDNKYDKLTISDFESEDDIVKILYMASMGNNTGDNVILYGNDCIIEYVMTTLLSELGVQCGRIELGNSEFNCYTLQLINDGDTGVLYIHSVDSWNNLNVPEVCMVYQEGFNQHILDHILEYNTEVLLFGFDSEDGCCDGDCEHCDYHEEMNEVGVLIDFEERISNLENKLASICNILTK